MVPQIQSVAPMMQEIRQRSFSQRELSKAFSVTEVAGAPWRRFNPCMVLDLVPGSGWVEFDPTNALGLCTLPC